MRTCVCNPAALEAAEELHARSKGYSTSVFEPSVPPPPLILTSSQLLDYFEGNIRIAHRRPRTEAGMKPKWKRLAAVSTRTFNNSHSSGAFGKVGQKSQRT